VRTSGFEAGFRFDMDRLVGRTGLFGDEREFFRARQQARVQRLLLAYGQGSPHCVAETQSGGDGCSGIFIGMDVQCISIT
jgi:hypothetical protein